MKKYEQQVEQAQNALQSINYEEGTIEGLEEKHADLKHEVLAYERRKADQSAKFPWLDFQYTDPERNFDRSQVRGVAAKLMRVKDSKFFVALDTAAGGKVIFKNICV